MLRKNYLTSAPQVRPPAQGNDRTFKFHVLCRGGAVTYRLNHRDIAVDHLFQDDFEMSEDSVIGFFHHWFHEKSHTHVRRLKIRRLEPPAKPAEVAAAPGTLAALREGFTSQSRHVVDDLHTVVGEEADTLINDLKRENKAAAVAKAQDFAARLKKPEVIQVGELPQPGPGEEWLATLLLGYHDSLQSRLATVRQAWKGKARELMGAAEAAEVAAFVNAELEPRPSDEPEDVLAGVNAFKWQKHSGEWTRTAEALTGGGDSLMRYAFNRAAPFQIDFEITVHEGLRPRLLLGNVKFANEDGQPTFALYPRPKDGPRFSYEHKKPCQITIKATKEKTELFVDGVSICEGPKVEGVVDVLQFRGGDWWSKGKTEFRKIRISPLP